MLDFLRRLFSGLLFLLFFLSCFDIRSGVSTSSTFGNDGNFFFEVFSFGVLSPVVVSDFHQPCRRILIVHAVLFVLFFLSLLFVLFCLFMFFLSFPPPAWPVCWRVERTGKKERTNECDFKRIGGSVAAWWRQKKKERKRRRRRRQKRIECRELPALRLITAHCHRSNRDKLLNRKKEEKKTDDWLLREIVYRSPIGTRSRLKRFLALLISRHVRFQRRKGQQQNKNSIPTPKKLHKEPILDWWH